MKMKPTPPGRRSRSRGTGKEKEFRKGGEVKVRLDLIIGKEKRPTPL